METVAAAVAAIPPSSHVVKHLQLKSRLPRKDGDVTVCTQCSLDRLERLEAQTKSWSGVISAAVMCPCPCSANSLRAAKQSLRALHGRVDARGGQCRLDIILVAHRTNSIFSSCQDPWQYPINALRNVALQSAATELVILLDVDFLPGFGIQEQLWKKDVYSGYLRACTDLRRIIILPALEESPDSETASAESSSGDKAHLQSALQIVTGGKVNVEKLWTQRQMRTFAIDNYPRGHGRTDTERWISSVASYEVQYEVDYEPYFLCSRRLVPWYDERFAGYGKNKIIHVFHTAVLDFRFWVHPEWYVLHVDHQRSLAWQATLGSDPLASKRLSDIKLLYEIAKLELLSLPTHSGLHLSLKTRSCPIFDTLVPSNSCCSWTLRQNEFKEEPMGHWNYEDQPSPLLLQTITEKYIQALYDVRYNFCVPKLYPLPGIWPLLSNLPRHPRDISLVTVATPDRLQRLLAQCCQWKGVICAAIYAPSNTNVKDLEKQLLRLHLDVEKAGTCRLDLILMESIKDEQSNCCYLRPRNTPSCKHFGRRPISSDDLCPINVLRNAALGLATTDLVLILDVDLLPAPSLNDCFLDEQQYTCLWRIAMEERTAVVVPSFEYAIMSLDPGTGHGNVEDCPTSQPSRKSISGFSLRGDKKTIEIESTFQELKRISEAQEMTGKGLDAMCKSLAGGDLRGFHVKHYPAGHSPTDFERWRKYSENLSMGDRPCCEVCRSYSITYAEGFEPFIICSRKLIPSFDERFRGYGYDKVTFFYHLHLSGFKFRVLLHSFALDIPHPKSQDWMKTFGPGSDPFQHSRVKALYQRAKREISLVTGGSALANQVVDELPVHLKGSAKLLTRFLSKGGNQFRISASNGERRNKSTVGGLQLAWQGKIHRHYSHYKTSLEFDEEEGPSSSCYEEDKTTCVGSGRAELRPKDTAAKQISYCFGWNCFGAHRVVNRASLTKTFSSIKWERMLEEFEWDSRGWELKCSTDSLSNCTVVKALPEDPIGDNKCVQTGDYWLRIFMSAGSWSPQASRSAGITTCGVSVRSALPMRAITEMVARYMVRFPSSFQWVKGGTLPGLWLNDVVRANFGWRSGGEGHMSTALIGLSLTEIDHQTTSSVRKASKLSRPFYFVPGQWHALQLAVAVVRQTGTIDQERGDPESKMQINSKRSVPLDAPGFDSVGDGFVIELRAFADFELVSTTTFQNRGSQLNDTRNSRGPEQSMGLLLSCFFGGKTEDWATPEDTHIDFSQQIYHGVSRSTDSPPLQDLSPELQNFKFAWPHDGSDFDESAMKALTRKQFTSTPQK